MFTELDRLASPNGYVAIPTAEDSAYTNHFIQVCRRYNIDFSKADSDERDFVIRMAEKNICSSWRMFSAIVFS